MCHAWVEQGHDVTLVGKAAAHDVREYHGGPHAFYGLPPLFDVLRFQRPSRRGGGLTYAVAVARLLFRERRLWDLVYSRNLMGAWLATLLKIPVVFEAHELLPGRVARSLLHRICRSNYLVRVVSITDALRRDLKLREFVPMFGDSIVAPSAVNHEKFRPTEGNVASHPDWRFGEGLQIGYIGNLYAGRGVEIILELAKRMPSMAFHFVGGDEKSLAQIRKRDLAPNVVLHGFVRPECIGSYYDLFDVLLLPHQTRVMAASGSVDIARWCSPIKLFEYMATGKAIVASDLPVLGEVLRDGENALIVPAADIDAWEDAIRRLATDEQTRFQLGRAASRECLRKYTWTARANIVLEDLPVGAGNEWNGSERLPTHEAPGFQGGIR
jgi:glycosyltransferase involved in cell wall biosynthesis